MDGCDARVEWLAAQAPRWRAAKEKTLVFVAHRETLEMLRTALSHRAQLATGVFHEDADAGPARHRGGAVPRDRRSQPAGVHRMRRRGPQLRVLPPPGAVRPAVEAVGRRTADRPARSHRPPHPGRDRLLPSARRHRPRRRAAVRGARPVPRTAGRPRAAAGARRGRARGDRARSRRVAVGRALRRRWSPRPMPRARAFAKPRISSSIAIRIAPRWRPAILARVPKELDALNEEVVVTASIGLGFTIEHPRGHRVFSIELGNGALGRRPAGRARRVELCRHVRSRRGGRERDHRLLRLRASAGRRHLRPLRRQRARPRRSVRDRDRPGQRRGARGDLQGRPRVRGRRDRQRRQPAARLGRGDPAAAHPRRPRRWARRPRTTSGGAWCAASARSSMPRAACTPSRPSSCGLTWTKSHRANDGGLTTRIRWRTMCSHFRGSLVLALLVLASSGRSISLNAPSGEPAGRPCVVGREWTPRPATKDGPPRAGGRDRLDRRPVGQRRHDRRLGLAASRRGLCAGPSELRGHPDHGRGLPAAASHWPRLTAPAVGSAV